MRKNQARIVAAVVGGLIASAAVEARADIGRALFRGLTYAGNYNLLSSPQNGPFFNANQQNQRLEYNRLGGGYTYEQWRFFGPDSFNNPNTLDLGVFKVQLGRDPNLLANNELIGLHTRAGFTTTFIPEIFFQQETAQRNQNVFAGTSTAQAAPLQYNITVNTGVQDFSLSGNILLSSSGRLNALGFYDVNARLVNDGTYNADGVLLLDQKETDFDLGPINVSGNIIMDAVSAVAAIFSGNAISGIPTRVASGAAQKDRSLDDIIASLNAGEELSAEDRLALIQQSLASAYAADPLGALLNGVPSGQTGNDAVSITFTSGESDGSLNGGAVPEPGTLILVGSAALAMAWTRRRRA